jgi:dephospho-CoA kinase
MLIGISGKRGVGKDTVAKYFCTLDNRFSICKFATGVRKVVSLLTNIKPENMLTLEEKSLQIEKIYTLLQFESLLADGIMLITNKFLTYIRLNDIQFYFQEICGFHDANVELKATIGKLLQVVGGFFRNFIDPDVWVNYLFTNLKDEFSIISDVRYPNELQRIHEHRGIILHITKLDHEFPNDGRSDLHESENQLLLADFTMDNSGTLKDLHEKLDDFYETIIKTQ